MDAICRGRDESVRNGLRQALHGGSRFSLRWFTPVSEVDLCGHATLATAHILWEDGHLPRNEAALFETRSGLLSARPGPDGIELDFPSEPVSEPMLDPAELDRLQSALGRLSSLPARIGLTCWSSSRARKLSADCGLTSGGSSNIKCAA